MILAPEFVINDLVINFRWLSVIEPVHTVCVFVCVHLASLSLGTHSLDEIHSGLSNVWSV